MSRAVPRYRRDNPPLPGLVPNLFRVTVYGQLDLQTTINTFYYEDDGSLTTYANLQAIGNAWFTALFTTMYSFTSADWNLDSIKVENITNPTLVPAFYIPAGTQTGGGPAGHEPSFVSLCVSRVTAVRSACGRGRVYFPGVPSSYRTGNYVAAGAASTAAANVRDEVKTAFTVSGKTLTAWLYSEGSRSHKQKGAAPIVATTYDTLLATTRRRLVGRGK